MADKWLLVGGDSEIGAAVSQFAKEGNRAVLATTRRKDYESATRPFLDLTQPLENWRPPKGVSSACVFAAIARLSDCHSDPKGSARINVDQTIALVERLLDHGVHVVFLSTNQVFDGETPHVAAEKQMHPVSEYGRQKARTEKVLQAHIAAGAPVAVLRLAKVVSPNMALIQDWITALKADQPINAFADMVLAPTPIGTVAAAISAIMEAKASGLFQLTGNEDISYLDLARYVARRIDARLELVKATTAAAAGLPQGSTPNHTTLDSNRLNEQFGIAVPNAWHVIDSILMAQGHG